MIFAVVNNKEYQGTFCLLYRHWPGLELNGPAPGTWALFLLNPLERIHPTREGQVADDI